MTIHSNKRYGRPNTFKRNKGLPNLNHAEKFQILTLWDLGFHAKDIASHQGCCEKTVYNVLKKWKKKRTVLMGKSPGRKPKITKEIEDFIVTTSDEDRRLTSSEIRDKVQQTFCVEVNACTIRLQNTLSTNQKMLENYYLFHVVCTYFPEFGFSKKRKCVKEREKNWIYLPPSWPKKSTLHKENN